MIKPSIHGGLFLLVPNLSVALRLINLIYEANRKT
jgi:hypothetical protein